MTTQSVISRTVRFSFTETADMTETDKNTSQVASNTKIVTAYLLQEQYHPNTRGSLFLPLFVCWHNTFVPEGASHPHCNKVSYMLRLESYLIFVD